MVKRHDRNLGRYQKADGNVREAKAARDDHMAPIFLEVTICVSGIARIISKEARPANKGDVDLAAMSMASERQRDAGWNVVEDVGLVNEQDHRCAIWNVVQGCFQVPDAPALQSKLILDPRNPKVITPPAQPDRGVFEQDNP